jgi:hypothetical protein
MLKAKWMAYIQIISIEMVKYMDKIPFMIFASFLTNFPNEMPFSYQRTLYVSFDLSKSRDN